MTGKKRRGEEEGSGHLPIGTDKVGSPPEGTKTGMPLDIALSLLRPDELEKLRNYVTYYMRKYGDKEPHERDGLPPKPDTEQSTEHLGGQ